MGSSAVWDEETAEHYDETSAARFDPAVLGPTLDLLQRLAGGGPALELAIGTGRVGVPLSERGVAVSGIELSVPVLARLRAKCDATRLPVVLGDMATTTVPGAFTLVSLVFTTVTNLLTQDEQVACFEKAASHLVPGGRFLIELEVPPLRRLPPGQLAAPFDVSDGHLGFDTFDLVAQHCTSHHHTQRRDGSVHYGAGTYRFLWPAECDLMARIAGLELEHRFEDWHEGPFTSDSAQHVSVWRRPER